MPAFPPEPHPVAAMCRNKNCGRAFSTRYLEQRYCSVQCKDAAAKQRRRERDKLGRPAEVGPVQPTADKVHEVLQELGSDRMKAVQAAQDKAIAEGKPPAEVVRIGQEVLDTFRPVETEMEKAIRAFRQSVSEGGNE